jgi:hypothetical protein
MMKSLRNLLLYTLGLLAVINSWHVAVVKAEDALDRMTRKKLQAMREAIQRLKEERREVNVPSPLKTYRANMHVHSYWSHDSRGQVADIVAAAKQADTDIIMFTEHPAPHYDIVKDGHKGMHDGVLLIPGAETKGLLAYPRASIRNAEVLTTEDYFNEVQQTDGLAFISHLEERMELDIPGITGNEIYNTHADFKEEKRLVASMRNPLWLLNTAPMIQEYPQEALLALLDYPQDYLRRWDQMSQVARHTGVAANDSHQNVGIRLRLIEKDQVRVEDALGEKILELSRKAAAELLPIAADAKEGEVLFQLLLDPYQNSMRHAGTYLLLHEQAQDAVWDALLHGRAFVCFDGLASGRGVQWFAQPSGSSERIEMGGKLAAGKGVVFVGASPQKAIWKIIRNGEEVFTSTGYDCRFETQQEGLYRSELWLEATKPQIWVLTNPISVQGSDIIKAP